MTHSAVELRRRPLLLGLGALTAATLALEVLLTRLLSVLTWYSLAFLVIGMGLFGLTVGAVEVYLHPERYARDRLAASLADRALEAAIAMPLTYALLLIVPLRVEAVGTSGVLFLVFSIILAAPFVFAGAAVSAALTRSGLPVGRLYAVDLVGAAVGAPLVPALLDVLDPGSAMALAGAASALASAAFARSGDDARRSRRGYATASALTLAALVNTVAGLKGLVPIWVKGHAEERGLVAFDAWNSHSRIQVSQEGVVPAQLWGAGSKCTPPWVRQRWMTIDGDAGTALYAVDDPAAVPWLACDVTNLAHVIRPTGADAVIGVGGSRDIQAALTSGHRPVVGIELNQKILDVLRGPFGAPSKVADYPGVELVHDDGRSYLARSDRSFSVVQMSLIDTWAATGAGAHALGENGLYTLEAWRIFMKRLEPGGVFTVSRWYGGAVRDETARLLSLAVATLHDRGVGRARPQIVLAASGAVSTLLLSRDPFTADDLARIHGAASLLGFQLLVVPGEPDANPAITRILDAQDDAALERVTLGPTMDLRPPVDDRPFFFNMLRVRAWLLPMPAEAEYLEGNRRATETLGLAFVTSVVLAAGAIVFPLLRRARPSGRVGARLAGALAYFAIIGVAFMFVEIGLLQRLSIVLGHPAFSLVVVLASLVASAGLGSLASDKLPLDTPRGRVALSFVLAAILIAASEGLPIWAARIAPSALPSRIAFAAGLTAALGFPMGMAFPAGMRTYGKDLGDETPWLWGINGVAGVIASSGAIMIALEYGISSLMFTAAIGYAVLAPLTMLGARSQPSERG